MIAPGEIQRVAKGEIADKTVERDYVQTWILIAMSSTQLREKLVFKGGTALRKLYYHDYRYSEDLDFTLCGEGQRDTIVEEFRKIIIVMRDLANIQVQIHPSDREFENTVTCYVSYVGPFGGMMERNRIKTDITAKELLLCPIKAKGLLPHYSDQPENVTYPVYSVEEIVLEKLRSILNPARNEPRDVYDLWYILEREKVDVGLLASDFKKKCQFARIALRNMAGLLKEKEHVYEKLWEGRLRQQMPRLPDYEGVSRSLQKRLRELELP
jgi:predicted nucleotidyltransferase component of viral defense system